MLVKPIRADLELVNTKLKVDKVVNIKNIMRRTIF